MRYYYFLVLFMWFPKVLAVEWEDRRLFEGQSATHTLRVISNTDTSVFAPIIERFLIRYPALNIEYLVAGSVHVYDEFRDSPTQYDLVISSAMDLQLKLVNDGYAHRIQELDHPDWAQWRQSLFGFTLESASIVVNKQAFATLPVPTSRQELIEVLRENPATFKGKIGTYDVRQSGLGYLFATQDARASETYWRLMEIMGSLEARLYCCSGDMIKDLANGNIAIAYNVLGSYAMARVDIADEIEVVIPSDFPITMMRTALIAKDTSKLRFAISFLRFLTTMQSQEPEFANVSLALLSDNLTVPQRSIITLEPGLMVHLDSLKRQKFIKEWQSAIIQ